MFDYSSYKVSLLTISEEAHTYIISHEQNTRWKPETQELNHWWENKRLENNNHLDFHINYLEHILLLSN